MRRRATAIILAWSLLGGSVAAWLVTSAQEPSAPAKSATAVHAKEKPATELLPSMTAEQTTTTAAPPAPPPPPTTAAPRAVDWPWGPLADCESGDWDRHRNPVPNTRRWNDRRAGYEGGLHFAPGTWDAYKPAGFPESAADASPQQQVEVAVRVRDGAVDEDPTLTPQGWAAWPTCSYKIGAR